MPSKCQLQIRIKNYAYVFLNKANNFFSNDYKKKMITPIIALKSKSQKR